MRNVEPQMNKDSMKTDRTRPGVSIWSGLRQSMVESRAVQVLGAVLLLQLVLAGGLYVQSSGTGEIRTTGPLLAMDAQRVDTVSIDSGEKQLTLRRKEGGWYMDEEPMLPADESRVAGVIQTLAALSPGMPVAMTTAAQDQLEVADENFQRHLILRVGDEVIADVYLGTSPGYRKAHLRKAGDSAIYAAELNVFDLTVESSDWLDRQLLAFSGISRIRGEGFSVARAGDNWLIEEPAELVSSRVIADAAMQQLLTALETLRVTGLASEPADDGQSSRDPAMVAVDSADQAGSGDEERGQVQLQIWTSATESAGNTVGEPLTLTATRHADEVTLRRSDYAAGFQAPISLFDTLQGIDVDTLLVNPPEPGSPKAGPGNDPADSASSNESVE